MAGSLRIRCLIVRCLTVRCLIVGCAVNRCASSMVALCLAVVLQGCGTEAVPGSRLPGIVPLETQAGKLQVTWYGVSTLLFDDGVTQFLDTARTLGIGVAAPLYGTPVNPFSINCRRSI